MGVLSLIGGQGTPAPAFVLKHDGSWSSTPTIPVGRVTSISGTAEDDLWAGMFNASTGNFGSLLYHFNGTLWTAQTLPSDISDFNRSVRVKAVDDQVVFVVCKANSGGNYRVYRTADGGASWTVLKSGVFSPGNHPAITFLPVGPEELYMCHNAAFLNPSKTGVWRWTLSGGWATESGSVGLPHDNGVAAFTGLAWDRQDPNDIWIVYSRTSVTARLYRGKFGGPWTLIETFDSATYGLNLQAMEHYCCSMDTDGTISILLGAYGLGSNVRCMQGDPTSLPLTNVRSIAGSLTHGEIETLGGRTIFADAANGQFFDGSTWSVPPNGTWGLATGAHLIQGPEPPVLQNQSPAPSSTGNRGDGAIYLEVVDPDSDLAPSSVQIWVNGTPAWEGSAAKMGFSGGRSTVTDGYGYTFTPNTPLPVGTQTIRVRAVDQTGLVMDESYTFDTRSYLDSVDRLIIPTTGGTLMVASGLFTRDQELAVHLGALGTTADPPCYGLQGNGYSPHSEDGVTVEFASPPLAKGAADLTIVDGVTTLTYTPIQVVERNWPGVGFISRRQQQPWGAVGARRLELEDLE